PDLLTDMWHRQATCVERRPRRLGHDLGVYHAGCRLGFRPQRHHGGVLRVLVLLIDHRFPFRRTLVLHSSRSRAALSLPQRSSRAIRRAEQRAASGWVWSRASNSARSASKGRVGRPPRCPVSAGLLLRDGVSGRGGSAVATPPP